MKKLLVSAIIFMQLSSLVFAAIPMSALTDELASPGTVTVYNLSKLFSVVVNNTMLSLKEIAALAGLSNEKTAPLNDNHNSPSDKAASNPASIAQAVRANFAVKSAAKLFTACYSPVSHKSTFSLAVSACFLRWLFLGCMLILIYRLKLFYNSARSAIDFYNAIVLPIRVSKPRFVIPQIGVFLFMGGALPC